MQKLCGNCKYFTRHRVKMHSIEGDFEWNGICQNRDKGIWINRRETIYPRVKIISRAEKITTEINDKRVTKDCELFGARKGVQNG